MLKGAILSNKIKRMYASLNLASSTYLLFKNNKLYVTCRVILVKKCTSAYRYTGLEGPPIALNLHLSEGHKSSGNCRGNRPP
jgi:hypothetical protein